MDHVSEMWAKEKAARAEKQRRNAELVKENTREENEREKSDEEEEEKEEEEEREDEELRSESDEETDRTQQQAIKANNKATKAEAKEKPRESGGDGAAEDEANMRYDRALGVICCWLNLGLTIAFMRKQLLAAGRRRRAGGPSVAADANAGQPLAPSLAGKLTSPHRGVPSPAQLHLTPCSTICRRHNRWRSAGRSSCSTTFGRARRCYTCSRPSLPPPLWNSTLPPLSLSLSSNHMIVSLVLPDRHERASERANKTFVCW
jgi:hypothetical protein